MHDFDHFRKGQVQSGVSEETVEELRRAYPQARHPICRTHPETGGEMLYVNPVFGRYIEETETGVPMDQAQSDAILAYLYEQANHPEYNFVYVYRPGDMTFVSTAHRDLNLVVLCA